MTGLISHGQPETKMIRNLPPDDQRWLVEQLEREGLEPGDEALASMATEGGAFDDLADEPDIYSFSEGEALTSIHTDLAADAPEPHQLWIPSVSRNRISSTC